MNPVIVIPTYWDNNQSNSQDLTTLKSYDHATHIEADDPELEACLTSLDNVNGVMRVIVLLVCPADIRQRAYERVLEICERHSGLNICLITQDEARIIQDSIELIAPEMQGEYISLRGYGSIKNMGLCVASILGHDCVVFMDDDEIALDPNYLIDAVYGLGRKNRQNIPLLVKSGYYQRADGSPFADASKIGWTNKYWDKKKAFNAWMEGALAGTRISKSNILCKGCMALHAQAFTKVAFDPFITRGEDMDYLISLRMYGIDVWFDKNWYVRHIPPSQKHTAPRFLADAYRWLYESQKVAWANAHTKLRPITAQSLSPYPAEWIRPEVISNISITTKRRMMTSHEKGSYYKIWSKYLPEAMLYAQKHAHSYFVFMNFWPTIVMGIWNNKMLADTILETAQIPIRNTAVVDDEGACSLDDMELESDLGES